MTTSRTQLKQRAALGALGFVAFALCLVGAFVYGTSFTPPAARGNVTIVEVAQNQPAPPAPKPTPPPSQPAEAPDLSEAAKLALKREEYRDRLAAMGVKVDAYRWFQSERIVIWAQQASSANPEDPDRYPVWAAHSSSPARFESWLSAFETDYGECPAGKNGAPPLMTVIFRDMNELRQWVWSSTRVNVPAWAGGVYLPTLDASCVPGESLPRGDAEVLRHELFHAFQWRVAPNSSEHRWFVEGSATWVGRAAVTNGKLARDGATVQRGYGYMRYLLRSGVEFDLRQLFKLTPTEFYANPMVNYLGAFLLVDFLLERPDLRKVYFAYWNLLREGKTANDAFEATFGKLDLAAVAKRFMRQIRAAPVQRKQPAIVFDAPSVAEPNKRMPLPKLRDESDDAAFDETLQQLKAAGIDIDRVYPFDEKLDQVIVCVDSSSAGSLEHLNFGAFNLWLFCCRMAAAISTHPANWGIPEDSPCSMRALYLLVECAVEQRESTFAAATGMDVTAIAEKLRDTWSRFKPDVNSVRKCYVRAAEALLSMTGGLDESFQYLDESFQYTEVRVLDFRSDTIESNTRYVGSVSLDSPFEWAEQERVKKGKINDNACDWNNVLRVAAQHAAKNRTMILFFTHNADSNLGSDAEALANRIRDNFKATGADKNSKLVLLGAHGADVVALKTIDSYLADVIVDDWSVRFGR